MFNFFRKKSIKPNQEGDGSKKAKAISNGDPKIADNIRQFSQPGDGYSPEKQKRIPDGNESVRCLDPKTTTECVDPNECITISKSAVLSDSPVVKFPNEDRNPVSKSSDIFSVEFVNDAKKPLSSIKTDLKINGETAEQSKDDDASRRNSKTNKEIVNLLLPEDSVKYKKDSSYLSRSGVQNLLDKMGRGKKKYKNEKKKNRSWSFGGNKLKGDDEDEDNLDEAKRKDFKYVSNSNVFTNLSEEFDDDDKSDQQQTETEDTENKQWDNIFTNVNNNILKDFLCDIDKKKYERQNDPIYRDSVQRQPVQLGNTPDNADSGDHMMNTEKDVIRDVKKNEVFHSAEAPRSRAMIDSDPRPSDAATPVGVPIVLSGSATLTNESRDHSEELTSKSGSCAKKETGEGGRWYFGTEREQSGAKRDTTRSPVSISTGGLGLLAPPQDAHQKDDEVPVKCYPKQIVEDPSNSLVINTCSSKEQSCHLNVQQVKDETTLGENNIESSPHRHAKDVVNDEQSGTLVTAEIEENQKALLLDDNSSYIPRLDALLPFDLDLQPIDNSLIDDSSDIINSFINLERNLDTKIHANQPVNSTLLEFENTNWHPSKIDDSVNSIIEEVAPVKSDTLKASNDIDVTIVDDHSITLKYTERPQSDLEDVNKSAPDNSSMGTSESRQIGKHTDKGPIIDAKPQDAPQYVFQEAKPTFECDESIEQQNLDYDTYHDASDDKSELEDVCDKGDDGMRDFVVVVENNTSSKEQTNPSDDSTPPDRDSEDVPVVKGSLSLEIMKLDSRSFEKELEYKDEDKLQTEIIDAIEDTADMEKKTKNILKEDKMDEKPATTKKHVTFHNFIEFDDGDRIEDEVCEDDSFTSFDEVEDESSVFQIEADNDENPDTESDQNEIVEFEDSSISDDAASIEDLKKIESEKLETQAKKETITKHRDALVIEELEVENDENVGYEGETDSEEINVGVVEEADEKSEDKNKTIIVQLVESTVKEEAARVEIEKVREEDTDEDDLEEETTEEEIEEEIEEEEIEEEEVEEEEEDEGSSVDDTCAKKDDNKDSSVLVECERCKPDSDEQKLNYNKTNNKKIMDGWNTYLRNDKEESAYSELLAILEKQMRGLVGQDERLTDLQERAAALHRVQNEVSNARKEAELVRQKLWHVEADLAATRCRNSQILEQLEVRTEEAKAAEAKINELTEKAARLQELLDKLIPENEQLKEKYKILKTERDEERKIIEETLAQAVDERNAREEWWRLEFEKLRSQGAEREELLLADCEWKLREVQQAARERGAIAEQRLRDLQRQTDERCALADSQLAEIAEVQSLKAEIVQLRQAAREQQRALRLAGERASHAAQAETEAARLRALLDREKNAFGAARAQYTKDLEEKENRLIARLQEQASRLEMEWKQQRDAAEQERRAKEQEETCQMHESMLKDAYDRLEILKSTLAKKEAQYAETLERTKTRADWEMLELRRLLDKTENKHSEAVEKLEEEHARETEELSEEMERKLKEMENSLTSQAVSARTTLELVKGQLQADHAENLLRLKEKYKAEMEKQWDIFTADKEECLERMKAECIQEGEEEREKREKELITEIEVLKNDLAAQEKDLNALRYEARKSTEAKIIAEKKLSEVQTACETRELGVRAEVSRQAEVAQREARETIEHLTKKCACLSNLFEDMRTRWQQAPGEAAQLRKALQDEKAKSAALRRQLDALSRFRRGGDGSAGEKDNVQKEISTSLNEESDGKNQKELKNDQRPVEVETLASSSSAPENQNPDQILPEKIDVNESISSETAKESGFIEVKHSGRKRRKKRSVSPVKPPVYLPPVTVPVRIRQFDPNRKQK